MPDGGPQRAQQGRRPRPWRPARGGGAAGPGPRDRGPGLPPAGRGHHPADRPGRARAAQEPQPGARRRWRPSCSRWTAWPATPPPATACCARSPAGPWAPRPPAGPSRASSAPPPVDEMLGPVAQADAEALAMILAREQPQTVALVLGSLEQHRAGLVLKLLPERLRPQVLRRLATLESVAPEVLREVGQALQAELRAGHGGTSRRVDGKAAAVAMLRRVPAAQQTEVVAEIEKDDPELATELRTKLFTFEDLGEPHRPRHPDLHPRDRHRPPGGGPEGVQPGGHRQAVQEHVQPRGRDDEGRDRRHGPDAAGGGRRGARPSW